FDNNNTYEMQPIEVSDSLMQALRGYPHVASVHRFLTKPGIVKTDDAFQGIVFKGTDYWDYFAKNLQEGALPQKPNEVLISRRQASALALTIGDGMLSYFVDEQVRARKFTITGIYETGFGEFDELFVLGQPEVVRRLNGWDSTQVSGVEILLDDIRYLDATADEIYFATVNHLDENGYNVYYVQTLHQLNPQVFAWLDLLDMNVVVIILLMLAVSGFTIISGLIILILDGVQLIGVLKALGADNGYVRRIFIAQAAMLIGKGMLWGNVLGLGLAALQYFTHWIPLEASTYYVNFVPIAFPWGWLLMLNAGILLVSLLVLLAPSAIITRISPAKVMHFE
ncbi:MAG: ABC transporter permease, partial [Paludibacteraceae bacterium]